MAIQKWEYLREKIWCNADGDEVMRERGEDGWELVSVMWFSQVNVAHFYFKRPKQAKVYSGTPAQEAGLLDNDLVWDFEPTQNKKT
mgnify:CR=1 FL=1